MVCHALGNAGGRLVVMLALTAQARLPVTFETPHCDVGLACAMPAMQDRPGSAMRNRLRDAKSPPRYEIASAIQNRLRDRTSTKSPPRCEIASAMQKSPATSPARCEIASAMRNRLRDAKSPATSPARCKAKLYGFQTMPRVTPRRNKLSHIVGWTSLAKRSNTPGQDRTGDLQRVRLTS